MAGLLHLVQKCFDVPVPVIKHTFSVLVLLFESYLPSKSVDFGLNPVINHHVANLLFGSVLWHTDESGQRRNIDFAIVLLDNSEIMLDQLPDQVTHVRLAVLCFSLKWLKRGHLLLDLCLVQGHQLKS